LSLPFSETFKFSQLPCHFDVLSASEESHMLLALGDSKFKNSLIFVWQIKFKKIFDKNVALVIF
jgi:hypothetical protein